MFGHLIEFEAKVAIFSPMSIFNLNLEIHFKCFKLFYFVTLNSSAVIAVRHSNVSFPIVSKASGCQL